MKHNTTTSFAADCLISTNDPDIAPDETTTMVDPDGAKSFAGNRLSTSLVTRHRDGAAFVCVDVRRGSVGLHFLLTAQGAREQAKALLLAADDAEKALAATAQQALARITGKGGAA